MNKLPEVEIPRPTSINLPRCRVCPLWPGGGKGCYFPTGCIGPGVRVLVNKENLTKEVISGVLDKMAWSEKRGWDECAGAILARLGEA